jgi:hypothetical protein
MESADTGHDPIQLFNERDTQEKPLLGNTNVGRTCDDNAGSTIPSSRLKTPKLKKCETVKQRAGFFDLLSL